mmetsp:Transcript_17915/g.19941  ORF Transcript_17915/g.19941 Transcript_17915/m.19941 type:complete len:217 (+) Transcript_17915:418-1068(+)
MPRDQSPSLVHVVDDLQLNAVFVEYRGYGDSTGTPAMATMLDDIKDVFEALKLRQEDIIVYGRSIGSIFAIHFAHLYPNIAGLIIDSGLAHPFNLSGERLRKGIEEGKFDTLPKDAYETCKKEASILFDHENKLKAYPGPLLLFHTKDDKVLPVEGADEMLQWAEKSRKKHLVKFEIGGHNYIWRMNVDEYCKQLREFIPAHCGHVVVPPKRCTIC